MIDATKHYYGSVVNSNYHEDVALTKLHQKLRALPATFVRDLSLAQLSEVYRIISGGQARALNTRAQVRQPNLCHVGRNHANASME